MKSEIAMDDHTDTQALHIAVLVLAVINEA